MNETQPTVEEQTQLSINAFKGIDVGIGQADPIATIAQKLEAQHPGHLILVQAGKFLHGYDRTAYALATLKQYKLKLVGTAADPHIRVGFPVGNYKRRLWIVVEEFGIPCVVALGTLATGRTVYVSSQPTGNNSVLESVSTQVIEEVILDLKQRGEVNKAAAKQLLANPDSACFQLKAKTQELDTEILRDIIKMPRDMPPNRRVEGARTMNDEQETNHAFARSRSNAGLGVHDPQYLKSAEVLRAVLDVVTKADDEMLRRMIWNALDKIETLKSAPLVWMIGVAEADRRGIAI